MWFIVYLIFVTVRYLLSGGAYAITVFALYQMGLDIKISCLIGALSFLLVWRAVRAFEPDLK